MAERTLDDVVAAITAGVASAQPEELSATLHAALAGLGPFLGVERAYLVAVDGSSRRVVLADEWCIEGTEPALSTVLAMGPQVREEQIRRRLARLGVKSVLMVPARPGGSLTGTIFVATSKGSYRPVTHVMTALQTIVDAFVDRLVGVRADKGKLAMRDQLGRTRPELPPT